MKGDIGLAAWGSDRAVEWCHIYLGFCTYGVEIPIVAMTGALPSQPDGSGSVVFALFNIQSVQNGGLEVALRAMDQLGVDIGFILETKYTRFAWAGGTCPRFAWAGGTFFPVVLLCQFLVLAGNRFWLYIRLCAWSTIQLWCCVSFFGSGGK